MIIATGGEKKEKTEKLVSIMLLTCFKKISDSDGTNLSEMRPEDIDPMTEEYKNLVELEKWKEMYEKNDHEHLQEELSKVASTMKEIDSETAQSAFQHKQHQSKHEEKKKAEEEFEKKDAGQKAYGLFGFNFREMNSTTKNLIGFSFLSLIGLLAFYALKTVQKPEKKKKKEKKA